MKLLADFADFLKNTVNLNATRIDTLSNNVDALKAFVENSRWTPTIRRWAEQGSWAHETIIQPVDLGEFDADILAMVNPVEDWSAEDYVRELGDIFLASDRYKEKTEVFDYCVTITYAGDQKVDIAPCVVGREEQGVKEVCNKRADRFEVSKPDEYTRWLIDKNKITGLNSFRKATRLLKYMRDIKRKFTCSSVLLTTMLGTGLRRTTRTLTPSLIHRPPCKRSCSGSIISSRTTQQSLGSRTPIWTPRTLQPD